MKQYVTHGTGSAQTLSEVQNTNVVVYDTKADAEADLSNLSEGQIVATKDSGDELAQPVNEVALNNLHSVTSNAVANYANKAIKYKDVVINELVATSGGFVDITSYLPNNMNNFMFAVLWHYGINSANGAIGINADGTYFFATANSTTTQVVIRYYYTD